jgi:hypothetical protein
MDSTGTLTVANLNVSFKSAKLESISELTRKIQTTALANAYHMSALKANSGTPIPAAATALRATAENSKSGMLLLVAAFA